MPTYELIAFGTDRPGFSDLRHREYTRSRERADRFKKVPRIPFTDSGHGIVFIAREMNPGERRQSVHRLRSIVEHIEEHGGGR